MRIVEKEFQADFGERLMLFRKSMKLTQSEMAEEVGMSLKGYQGNERGIASPSAKLVDSCVDIGVNSHWLLTGIGEMLLEDTPAEKYQALRKTAEEALKYIDARTKGIALDVKDSLRIELYGTLSGQPEDTQESKPPEANPLEAQVIDNKEKINILWGCARDMNTAIDCLREMHERTRQPLIKRVWDWVFGNNVRA